MGLFSLMDIIAETDISETLKEMPLEKDVVAAILGEESDISYILNFVKAYESGDWEAIELMMGKINMNSDKMSQCYFIASCTRIVLFDALPR